MMMWTRLSPADRRPRQKGAILIELALILPLLVMLAVGVVEAARAIAEYKAVVRQVRAAARYLTAQTPGSGREQAICIVKTGDAVPAASCTGAPVLKGLADPTVTIAVNDALSDPTNLKAQNTGAYGASLTVNLVTVSVTDYPYTPITGNLLKPIFGSVIRFGKISVTMRQVL